MAAALLVGVGGCTLLLDTDDLASGAGADAGPSQPEPGADAAADAGALDAFAQIAPDAAAPRLIADWPFDEGSGTSIRDATERGHDGTATGGTWVTDTLGAAASALELGGAVVNVPASPELDRPAGAAFTLTAWMRRTGPLSHNLIVSVSFGTKDNSFGLEMQDDDTFVYYDGKEHIAPAKVAIADGSWNHFAAAVEGREAAVFFNGKRVGIGLADDTPRASTGLMLGGSTWGDRLKGAIDRVRIYAGALTEEQVAEDMKRP